MVRRWSLAALVVALVAACSAGAGEADRRVVVFNYCGNVCAAGRDDGAGFVVDLVAASGAEAVLLQEVCRSQAEHLAAELRMALHYVSTAVGDLGGLNRCPGDDYGLAVLARSMGRTWVVPLPNPGLGAGQLDARSMPCAEVGGGAVACTTHLVRAENDAVAHEAQVEAFAHRAAELAAAHDDLVVAGDLNDELAGLDGFVAAGHGVDRAFASSAAYAGVEVERHACRCSDHDALVVSLARRPAT